MEPAPRAQADGPLAPIVGTPLVGRLRPGRRVGADELGPMAPRSAGRGLSRRVGGAAAAGPPADQEADGRVGQGQGQAQLDRVVARVEADDGPGRGWRRGRHLAEPRAALLSGHRIAVLARGQPAHPPRGGPAGAAAGQGGAGRGGAVGPARRSSSRRRSAGQGNGGPEGEKSRVPGWFRRRSTARHWRRRHTRPCRWPADRRRSASRAAAGPGSQRGGRHQTQRRQRFAGWGGQERIEQFEQRIAAAPTQRIHLVADGSQLLQFWRVHTSRMGSWASPCPLRPNRPIAVG